MEVVKIWEIYLIFVGVFLKNKNNLINQNEGFYMFLMLQFYFNYTFILNFRQ